MQLQHELHTCEYPIVYLHKSQINYRKHVVFYHELHTCEYPIVIQHSKSIRIIATHKYELLSPQIKCNSHFTQIKHSYLFTSEQYSTYNRVTNSSIQESEFWIWRCYSFDVGVDLICLSLTCSCFMLQSLSPNRLSNWWLLLVVPQQHDGLILIFE